jgi:hypothetical protein
MGGNVVSMSEMRNACVTLVRKSEGKRPLRRPSRRWKDLEDLGREDVDWINLDQDMDQWRSVVNFIMNLQLP